MSWGLDGRQYVSLCDGTGFSEKPSEFYNSRMLAMTGGPRDAKFHELPGYPYLGRPYKDANRNHARYFNFGTLALDGHLYQFMSTPNRSLRSDELINPDYADLMHFNAVKLIYSSDDGRTWRNHDGSTPVIWEPRENQSPETMIFYEEDQNSFALLTVLQMGRNYEYNRDGYVYVYSPNGITDGTMNELVMLRVSKLQLLNRREYEYFAGFHSSGNARWSRDIGSRKPVHTFPRGWVNKLWHPYSWHPSVVYYPAFGVYMMTNWGMGSGPDIDGWFGTKADNLWFAKPSYLGFWLASNPWGPWTQIHEEKAWLPAGDVAARAYQPQIAPKWIADDGKSFWLVWSDFQITDKEEFRRITEADQKRVNANGYGVDNVRHTYATLRKYQPYYGFNCQKIDVVIG